MNDIHDDTYFATLGAVYSALTGVVDREISKKHIAELTARCARIARGAIALYVVNRQLYRSLRELERIASSWSGNPGAQPAIVQAREVLQSFRADAAAHEEIHGIAWWLTRYGAPPL